MHGRNFHGNTVIPEALSTTPTAASCHSIDHILYIAGSVKRQPQQYGAIHASPNVSWAPSPAHNETDSDGKNIICVRQEPIAQQLPESFQEKYPYNKGISSSVDRSQRIIATSFESSTTNTIELDEVPSDQGKYHDEIVLYDEVLVSIGAKDLNKLLKKKRISKTRRTQIKARRRTLRNRGNFHISFSVYMKIIGPESRMQIMKKTVLSLERICIKASCKDGTCRKNSL